MENKKSDLNYFSTAGITNDDAVSLAISRNDNKLEKILQVVVGGAGIILTVTPLLYVAGLIYDKYN
jgi:hypothetical protein